MAFLNKVSLDCIAADPYSRYLYGIGSASDIQMADDPFPSAYMNPYLVLVKSNASPTNLSTVSWTVVSRVRGNDYSYSYPTFTSVDCATNGRGDFTAFFRSPYRTVSPAKLLPMGLRYSPDSGSWTAIQGTSLHGWTSEECFHKSFYTHPESPDVFHLLTTLEPYQLTFGRLDSTRNLLFPESSLIWGENGGFIQPGAGDARFNLNPYDYTKRGFFTPIEVVGPAIMAFHRDTFYFIGSYTKRFNITCPSITTSLSTMGRLGNSCTFQSPPEEEIQDGDIIQNYIFGGDRNGTTFFGGIYKINNVLKIFTTENVKDRGYVEYNLIRSDTSSDFVVDRNFQVVGGHLPGQEPFAVALTSAGLYQFNIFGPGAGTMGGPYEVGVTDEIYSYAQRVVGMMKDRTPLTTEEISKEKMIGGIAAAALVFLVIGGLFWRRRTQRRRRILEDKEKEKEKEKDVGSDSEDPEHAFVGKHEVYSMGLIPESESLPDVERGGLETRIDRPVSNTIPPNQSPPNARLPRDTYQDHIRDLDFSSHPRPNVVISVGEAETVDPMEATAPYISF